MATRSSSWSDEEDTECASKTVSASVRLRKLIEQHKMKKKECEIASQKVFLKVESENIVFPATGDGGCRDELKYDELSASEDDTSSETSLGAFKDEVAPRISFDTMRSVKSLDWVYTRQKMEEVEDCDFCPRLICAALNSNTAVRLWIGLENCKNESSKPQWAPVDPVEINFGALFGKLYLSEKVTPKLPEGVVCIQNVVHGSKDYDEFFEMKNSTERSRNNNDQFCLVAKVSVCPNQESNVTLYKFEGKVFFIDHLKKHLVFHNGQNIAEMGNHLAEKSVNYHLDMISGARWARERLKNSFQ